LLLEGGRDENGERDGENRVVSVVGDAGVEGARDRPVWRVTMGDDYR
jgi:hypothetical protein